MGLKRIDHIGVAVVDAEEVARLFCDVLGADPAGEEILSEGLHVVSVAAGDDTIEFFTPTRPDHTVRRFLDKRGGSALHHICIEVDDLDQELVRLRGLGIELVDAKPRPGAHGRRVAFLHPRSTAGLLIELSERASAGPADLAP
jgi:methylmalonyl-CoA/ethylmalonyl-CoA epimerase